MNGALSELIRAVCAAEDVSSELADQFTLFEMQGRSTDVEAQILADLRWRLQASWESMCRTEARIGERVVQDSRVRS